MSFRDLRNFLEMLRALGYPSLVSMESFRSPNFPMVANLLVWLSKRFDPDADFPLQIATEDDRIRLIRNVAEFMALKANIKLNTKKLYQADGYAVKELLKITTLLYKALNVNLSEKDEQIEDDFLYSSKDFDMNNKVNELKLSRQLATEITTSGAHLFDLLGKENELKPARLKSITRQFEMADVDAGIKKAIQSIYNELSETKQLIDNVAATESALDSKIDRRKIDIDRYEKRLQTLKKVRPAFLEEFTALEQELEQLFVQYSIRLRCLNQLEKMFSESERMQIEKQMEITSPRVPTIPLDLEATTDSLTFDENMEESTKLRQERPRAGTGGRQRINNIPKSAKPKTFGGMQPTKTGSHSSLDLSTDSESDDLFIDKDEPELAYSDDESLAIEMSGLGRAPTVAPGRKTSSKVQENSDDDF